jgi:hypothetical protein
MDEESIIRLAKEAGIYYREIEDEFCEADKDGVPMKMMAKFAALVSAAEREGCAREVYKVLRTIQVADQAATVIRARGK